MALYAIGDVQGCDAELESLLKSLRFSADKDRLWFVGDLVNRGPASLEVLRRVRALGAAATVTLGNHDLHLLAVAYGSGRIRSDDTLADILSAPDRDALLEWLLHRPLLAEDRALNLCLLHAGTQRGKLVDMFLQAGEDPLQLLREDAAFLGTHGIQAFHSGQQCGCGGQFKLGLFYFFRAGSFHRPNSGKSKRGVEVGLHASQFMFATGGAKSVDVSLDHRRIVLRRGSSTLPLQ